MPDAQDAPGAARPTPVPPRVARGSDGGWGRRTARRHRRATALSVLVVGLLLVAAVAVGAGLLGERDEGAVETLCTGGPTVEVVVDPTLAPTLAPVVAEAGRHLLSTGVCADVDVVARDSADAAALIAAAAAPSDVPQVWVPDSSVWLGRAVPVGPAAEGDGLVTLARLGSLVSTPLVLATSPEAAASEGWTEAGPTWQAALGSGRGLALPELSGSAVGLQSLVALRTSVADPDQAVAALTTAALAVERGQVADPDAAMALVAAGGAEATLAPTTEQQVFVANRGDGTPAVVGVQPSDGTTSLDHPLVRVDTPESEAGVDAAAIEGVLRVLEGEGRAAALLDGFREPLPEGDAASDRSPPASPFASPPAGLPRSSAAPSARASSPPSTVPSTAPSSEPSAAPSGQESAAAGRPVVPVPSAADVDALLVQLAELSRPSRLLAVVDASASMRGVTGSGATRAQIAQDASTSTLAMFPDSAAVGLWFFAIGMGEGTDHDEVVPVAPLDPAAGDQRAQLVEGIATLPDRLTPGGTGLYDTTLAAVRSAREQHDPKASNSVVLITDGREEDPSGISREELLATLQAEADPERPVRVIAIGISDDVDADELTAIAEATGGAAYLAERPEDFEAVLLDALARR